MPFVLGPSRLRPFFRVTTVADNSLRRAGTVRAVDDWAWSGLLPDNRTVSYPLLAVRKPAPTVAGNLDRNRNHSGVWGVVAPDVFLCGRPPPWLALLRRRRGRARSTPPRSGPWPRPRPGARDRRRRSPPRGHGDARPKRGTPLLCAPPCPPGGPYSDDTRASLPHESDAGTTRTFRVRWGPASCEMWERPEVSPVTPQRGVLLYNPFQWARHRKGVFC